MDETRNKPISVLIADGDPRVYRALMRLLHGTSDVVVSATAADSATALRLAEQLRPSVILVDAGSQRLDGMELTRRLCEHTPQVRVVVLSVYATFCEQALAAGACRFLLKDTSRDELLSAIRLAARGECQVVTSASAV